MYIRFVVAEIDEDSGREMGIFTAGGILHEDGELYDYEIRHRKEILSWFSSNLNVPDVQASESNYYSKPGAISWFKSSATIHISKMREYVQILESHDVAVKQLVTERPGNVVYEDDFQVAAIPFKDTFL
ncbi:hypothetical protein ACMXYV_07590 [Neptuniibacter sp. SY11_33]|uniref:hypothetical protein n=1 Tax=Neptuniibacter sp. SY11_33 TaxID=3398215 RepID=UPI0039F487F4